MIQNGRQVGRTLGEIRRDHVARYDEAVRIGRGAGARTAGDLGSGSGYGSWLLAKSFEVTAYDVDQAAHDYAEKHWHHPKVLDRRLEAFPYDLPDYADMLVAFEVLEHFHGADKFLGDLRGRCKILVGSVPNENVVPYKGQGVHDDHVRHYTPSELVDLLRSAGWSSVKVGSQIGKEHAAAEVRWDTSSGRTIVFGARP